MDRPAGAPVPRAELGTAELAQACQPRREAGEAGLRTRKGAASVLVALTSTFVFVVLLLLEAPKLRAGILALLSPERAERYTKIGGEVSRSVAGYMLGDILTSVIAGLVIFVTLTVLSVPFALLWALWVALVDFLPQIGGALAGIPTILFAFGHSVSAGITTAVVFLIYTQLENHILNPVIMSRTVKVNPLLVLVSVFVAADLGAWVGGIFGGFVAALLAIPIAGVIQVIVREVWQLSGEDPSVDRGRGVCRRSWRCSGYERVGFRASTISLRWRREWDGGRHEP